MSGRKIAVEVEALVKSYGDKIKALDGLSLSIEEGEIFGLIGPNGAGKTTLIGCLLALLRPDSGHVRIFGQPFDLMSVRAITGYMPERVEFEYWMTGWQFLHFHYGLSGRDPRQANDEVARALALVELDETAWKRRLKTYSRGMLQRLNLAQCVLGRPKLALLDEPTLGLDPTGVAIVRSVVSDMRANGTTAIINSHQLDEVERLCDRVAFIRDGKIAAIETLKDCEAAEHVLLVKWPLNTLNGTLKSVVDDAAAASGARVKEITHEWGRFLIRDNRAAVRVVSELVTRNVPVEEVVPERARLENLFCS
ncbi:MAG: ABC transporter ATP-binding protein [Cyanobacteria bacterium]|nr:ABC transporter ATP-binding protein [Cyanobacteriota bacterium]